MKVFYPGTDVGYHLIGKIGVVLRPGENELPNDIATAAIKNGICRAVTVKRIQSAPDESQKSARRRPYFSSSGSKEED